MNTTYLSIGTNLGNKEENLHTAIGKISERIGQVKAQSAFIQTEPWGFRSPNVFLNAAVCVETSLSPLGLLEATQQIEREMGRRNKPAVRAGKVEYADRIIDIDILLFYEEGGSGSPAFDMENDWGGTVRISTPALTIPHPHMHERDFVLIPLKEIL